MKRGPAGRGRRKGRRERPPQSGNRRLESLGLNLRSLPIPPVFLVENRGLIALFCEKFGNFTGRRDARLTGRTAAWIHGPPPRPARTRQEGASCRSLQTISG